MSKKQKKSTAANGPAPSKPTKPIDALRLGAGSLLEAEGFRRKGSSWFRVLPDVIQVVSFDKSSWGNQYRLRVGFWLTEMETCDPPPKAYQCHAQFLWVMVSQKLHDQIEDLLNFDAASIPTKVGELEVFTSKKLMPMLKKHSNVKLIAGNKRLLFTAQAREFLSLPAA